MSRFPTLRRRFARPLFWCAALASILELLVQHSAAPSRWLTLLPLLPMFLFVGFLVQAIRRMDELQHRISLLSMSIAFILTLVLTLAFIGLERSGFYAPRWDELGTYMLALWACAYVVVAWRYK